MKAKMLVFVFLLLCINTSFAQGDKLSLGVEVTPSTVDILYDEKAYVGDKHRVAVSLGAVVNYRINNHWQLDSGLRFLNRGSKREITVDGLMWGTQHDGGGGFDPGISSGEIVGDGKIIYRKNYYYLSIPLNVRYSFSGASTKGWYLRGGLSPSFHFVNQTTTINKIDGDRSVSRERDKATDFRKTNLNLSYGGGYAFHIKDKYQIDIEPLVEYMLLNTRKEVLGKSHLYSFGIATRFMFL